MSDKKPVYTHVVVPVPMAEDYETRTIRRQTGTRTVQKYKGLLNPQKEAREEPIYEFIEEALPTGKQSDCEIDADLLGTLIEEACNELDENGYDVISVTPVVRGSHNHKYSAGAQNKGTGPGGFGFGYGFSVTDSVVILGKLKT